MKQATPTGTGEQAPARPTPGFTVKDAANAFDAALSFNPEDKQEGTEEQPGAEAQSEVNDEAGDQQLETASAEEGEEALASEDEAPEGEQSEEGTEGEEEQAEAPAPDTKFTVKVDGKDETVTLAELTAGYSRTSDYTRKTQKLATERKEFETLAAAANAERTEYATLLPKLRAALEAGMEQEPNWDALEAEDPVKALLARQRWQDRLRKIEGVKAQEQQTQQRIQRERERQTEQIAIEQNNLLLEKLPAWRDPKVREADVAEIAEAMQAVGFSGEELKVFDHRALLLIRKAAKFDAIERARKAAKEKLKPVVQKAVKPGVAVRKNPASEKVKSASNQLKKTGRIDAAANLFESILK